MLTTAERYLSLLRGLLKLNGDLIFCRELLRHVFPTITNFQDLQPSQCASHEAIHYIHRTHCVDRMNGAMYVLAMRSTVSHHRCPFTLQILNRVEVNNAQRQLARRHVTRTLDNAILKSKAKQLHSISFGFHINLAVCVGLAQHHAWVGGMCAGSLSLRKLPRSMKPTLGAAGAGRRNSRIETPPRGT